MAFIPLLASTLGAQEASDCLPKALYPFHPVIVIVAPKFSPDAIKLMKEFWSRAGAAVRIAADERYEAIAKTLKKDHIHQDFPLSELEIGRFDALIFVGDIRPELCHDESYRSLIGKAYDLEILIGAMGCATLILAESGFLLGKATGCPQIRPYLAQKGIKYTGEKITWSKNALLTCRDAGSVLEFAYELALDFQIYQLPLPEWKEKVKRDLKKIKEDL